MFTTHALINPGDTSAAWGFLLAPRPRIRRSALACQDAPAVGQLLHTPRLTRTPRATRVQIRSDRPRLVLPVRIGRPGPSALPAADRTPAVAPRPSRTRSSRNRTERDRSRRILSQNSLSDPAAVERIVRAARPGPRDLIVEVGAGRGQLTRALAAECGRVLANEIDPHLAADLAVACPALRNVTCRPGDFLGVAPPRGPFAVVGNIPWALTAPVVDLRHPG
jgi:hypothetical protein